MEDGAITNKTGICVDYDSSMNEFCPIETVGMLKDALVGCFDDIAAKFLCGLSLDVRKPLNTPSPTAKQAVCAQIKHGDPSTVTTTGNPFWPRVLIEGSEDRDGDGEADPFMECTDPIGKSYYILLTRRMRTIHVVVCLRVCRLHTKVPILGAYESTRSWRTSDLRAVRRLPA